MCLHRQQVYLPTPWKMHFAWKIALCQKILIKAQKAWESSRNPQKTKKRPENSFKIPQLAGKAKNDEENVLCRMNRERSFRFLQLWLNWPQLLILTIPFRKKFRFEISQNSYTSLRQWSSNSYTSLCRNSWVCNADSA